MLTLHTWPTPNGKKIFIMLEELGISYLSGWRGVLDRRYRQRRMESGDDELEHQANVRNAALLGGYLDHFALQYLLKPDMNLRPLSVFPFNQNLSPTDC
jgi:hypothetical protein